MKLYLFLIISLCTTINSIAQGSLRLTIEWNSTSSRYEAFVLSPTTLNNFAIGKSQVSVVLPKAAPDSKLNVVSHAGGLWTDEKFIVSPEASSEKDFHGIVSSGGVVNLKANQGLLLFSFTMVDGVCRDGVRLYNNGSDPSSNASGFNDLDFSNSLIGAANVQLYQTNVSNSGTKCQDCPAEFSVPKLIKLSN